MIWSELLFSKNKVRKAGHILTIDGHLNDEETDSALKILLNWRAAHAYPMQSMLNLFRKKAFEISSEAVVVQRLKRLPSILSKLKREKMELERMDDIAGCRVIFDSIDQVKRFEANLKSSRSRNKLKKERDYIQNPKQSGYRGIHLIFEYKGQKTNYQNLAVELQIRSKIQHSWATAVEVAGTFLKVSLKSGEGDQEWLDFFKLAADGFYAHETDGRFVDINTLKIKTSTLQVINKLQAFSVAADHLSAVHAKYYIILLNIEARKLKFLEFEQIDQAQKVYTTLESTIDTNQDIVLVSADSIQQLQKAYPNYFADTTEFIKTLNLLFQS